MTQQNTDNTNNTQANANQNENFRQFFEAMNDMIVVAKPTGEVLYINSALSKKLGYTLDEVKAIGVLGLNPTEKKAEAEKNFGEMLRGELEYCPLAVVAKDGRWIPAETRITFGKWDGQDCVFGISKDMTEQHAAFVRFEKIFSSNPMPMAISSIDTRKFEDVNQAFLDLMGYPKEAIIGHSSEELGIFIDSTQQIALGDELENTGRIRNREMKVRTKSGGILTGLFSGEIIENQAGEKSFLTTMLDITESRAKEDELKKVNQMMIGREEKMVELKERVEELEKEIESSKQKI
jgi:PAS domain S-box-containing protein